MVKPVKSLDEKEGLVRFFESNMITKLRKLFLLNCLYLQNRRPIQHNNNNMEVTIYSMCGPNVCFEFSENYHLFSIILLLGICNWIYM